MKLFYSPGACSLSPNIVAHEAGINLRLQKVDLKTKTIDIKPQRFFYIPDVQ